jgi:hypothetical protein
MDIENIRYGSIFPVLCLPSTPHNSAAEPSGQVNAGDVSHYRPLIRRSDGSFFLEFFILRRPP